MIKIIDNWYITVETNPINYIVRRGDGKKDKKNAWTDRPLGFFGSLREAVKFIREQVIAENLLLDAMTLSEAIRTIFDTDMRFEDIIAQIEA